MPTKASDLQRVAGEGLFDLPSTALFQDFCEWLQSTLPHTFVAGAAASVDKRDTDYEVAIADCADRPVRARRVIFALGAAGAPKIPRPLAWLLEESAAQAPRVLHTYSWSKLLATPLAGETVVVVGGGLSAAQAALLAVRRGARRVVHVSRRPVQSRAYDLPFEWMTPRSGWRVASKDKSKDKFRMFEFYGTPKAERAAWVRSARGGATVPVYYEEELERAARAGHLERLVDEIAVAEIYDCKPSAGGCACEPASGAISLTFSHGASTIVADRVILATGSTLDVGKVPLLRGVAARFELPTTGSPPLPNLDEDLQWGSENFTVVGAFALLEVGPDSGNLTGCRRCAGICADNIGAFASLEQNGGPLANTYSALFDSDDEDSEDDSTESDP